MWGKVEAIASVAAIAVAIVASGMSDIPRLLLALVAMAWLGAVAFIAHDMNKPRF